MSRARRTPRVASSVPELVVPEILREAARQPQPAPVGSAAVGLGERAQRPRERRDRGRVSLGEPRHQGVEQRVGRARRRCPAATRARPRPPRAHPGRCPGAPRTSPTRSPRGTSRGPSRRPGDRAAWPPRAAAAARRARAGWRTRSARATAPAARAGARRAAPSSAAREQRGRGRGVGDVELRLRRGERALDAQRRDPASARPPAAGTRRPRPARRGRCARSAERASSAATASSGVAVACARCHARRSGSSVRVGRVRERDVHVAAVARVRRPVDRRADERMREAHAQAELDQARRPPPAAPASTPMPEPPGGAPQQAQIAQRLGRRRQQQQLRVARERLDALRGRSARCGSPAAPAGQPEPARQLGRRQAARQLDQRERVAACLGEDPRPHALVERPGIVALQQRAGRRRPARPATISSGSPSSACAVAGLAHARTPTRAAPPAAGARRTRASARTRGRATARRRRCTRAAAPRRRRPAGSGPPAPTRKRSGGGPALRPNAVFSASRCGAGQPPQAVEHRRAQRVQAGERELHLGLDAGRAGDPASLRRRRQVPQQGGLPDPRLAAEDQHAALARAHARDESVPARPRSSTRSSNPFDRWASSMDARHYPGPAAGSPAGAGCATGVSVRNGASGAVQGLSQRGDGLRDRRAGRVRVAERVEHHEVVRDAVVADGRDVDARRSQPPARTPRPRRAARRPRRRSRARAAARRAARRSRAAGTRRLRARARGRARRQSQNHAIAFAVR